MKHALLSRLLAKIRGSAVCANVTQLLKAACTMNFVLSILAYAAYVVYCLCKGIDIDQRMGIIKHGRGPAWAVVAFLEVQLLTVFVMAWFSDEPQTLRFRLPYILWGGLILVFFSGFWSHNAGARAFASLLVRYVGISDVLYGLIGSDDS